MNNKVKIIIFGDVCPTTDYKLLFDSQSPKELLGDSVDLIRKADLSLCNLECPITDSEVKIKKCGPNLKGKSKDVTILKNAGFKAVSLANNHILDYGQQGLNDTLRTLKENKIDVISVGKIESARKPYFVQCKNKKIGVIGFSEKEFTYATFLRSGANFFDPLTSLNDIKEAKKQCDYLIILYHGGIEYFQYPSPLLRKKCHAIVEAGANIVLCQHSHCIGTEEKYKDATILYGQGNSIFGYREDNLNWNEGLIVDIELFNNNVKIKYHLLNASPNGVNINHNFNKRMEKFYIESEKIKSNKFIENKFIEFCNIRKNLDLPLFYGKNRIFIKLNRIFNGKLLRLSKKNAMITNNLIRCDSWNEVIQEILRGYYDE